ncbi:transglycosylase SLT domain-containing protein [Pseudomonas sp. RIT-PI-S]|uniref:transglycosylase SLT domain-containing protein n=1 Tax=Pseudomonas sp. RIT-PI-S TaxID=3035295 RepID=UPI0021D9091E|nr:transglycosylase SLT domain-containing protein [Pseudomonas sp. RIT-PI-S]
MKGPAAGWGLSLAACSLLILASTAALAEPRRTVPPAHDLAQIRQAKVLRVVVNQSRNSSATIAGAAVGVEDQRLQAFEDYLNSQPGPHPRIHLKAVPRPKGQLLGALQRGEADLAAPGELLPATSAQSVSAATTAADTPLVLVQPRKHRPYANLDQLAGKRIVLVAGSAAEEAINRANVQLAARHRPAITVEWADPSLGVEDVLDMVSAGVYSMTLVEQPIAERWVKLMPDLRIERRLPLHTAAPMSWYVRGDAPQLSDSVRQFLGQYRPPANQDKALLDGCRGLYQTQYPLDRDDRARLEALRPVLQRNAREQGLDWLDLAALAYKESDLDPTARGSSGASGPMQITPAAARRVGVKSVSELDDSVKAAARYLALIRRNFFNSKALDERERMAFVLAAYNLGPERVQRFRAQARQRGLDPNRWFFQVERIAMENVGVAPVSYVNNVNKYYLAFDRARDSLEPRAR